MTDPLVSVVVLSWNGKHLLEMCLDACLAQTYPRVEVLVVDNASTDGTQAFVTTRYGDRVRFEGLPVNRGYARGNNEGFRRARGEFLVTLNNDTRVAPGWVAALVEGMGTSPAIGACASRQVRMSDPDVFDAIGIGVHTNGASFGVGTGEQDRGQYDRPLEVFGAHGASAMYRREALEEAGLFDEDFFAYEEEFDLNWRLRLFGWRCLYVPDARLEHVGGASVKRKPGLLDYLKIRNRFFCIIKNYPARALAAAAPAIAKTEAGNAYLAALRGDSFRYTARRDVFPYLGRMLKRRRRIQARRRLTDEAFRGWLNTPWRPWAVSDNHTGRNHVQ